MSDSYSLGHDCWAHQQDKQTKQAHQNRIKVSGGWSTVREFWLRTRRTRKGCDRQKTALCVPSRRNDVISHIQSRPPLQLTYLTAGVLLIVLSSLQEQGGLSIQRVLQMPQARTLEVVMHSLSYNRQPQHKLGNAT